MSHLKKFDLMYRILTSPWQYSPTLSIVGVEKGGTTSLYNYLAEHPNVVGSTSKGLHNFSHFYNKGRHNPELVIAPISH